MKVHRDTGEYTRGTAWNSVDVCKDVCKRHCAGQEESERMSEDAEMHTMLGKGQRRYKRMCNRCSAVWEECKGVCKRHRMDCGICMRLQQG